MPLKSPRPHRMKVLIAWFSLLGIGTLLLARDFWLVRQDKSRKLRPIATLVDTGEQSEHVPAAITDEKVTESTPAATQRRFLPQPSNIPGYLEVPGVVLPDGQRSDPNHMELLTATERCNINGPKCWGFLFSASTGVSFQHSFTMPRNAPLRRKVFYIKKEFAALYERGLVTNLTCAVPLQEFTAEKYEGTCQLPYVDVFDKNVLRIAPPISSLNCTGRLYTTFNHSQLTLMSDVTTESGVTGVQGQPIRRSSDFLSTLDNPETLTLDRRNVRFADTDFVRAEVRFKNGSSQVEYHASVMEKDDVHKRPPTKKYPLDIMMLMFDGTSSAHFQRMLRKTFQLLSADLKGHVFKAYSIVGENTNPAMTALLTGRTVQENIEEYGDTRRHSSDAKTVDDWPFIFKDFKRRGFATMLSEDQPYLGAFSMGMMGFDQEPADHYGRTIWQKCTGVCIGSRPQFAIQLDYLRSFMRAYPGRRKFGVTFLSDLCHRTANLVSGADEDLANFLRSIRQEGLLDETMLLVMSDHGARFGDLRHLPQGRIEHRLPFLSIALPSWFEEQNPGFIQALQANANVLTSPFDVHRTFKHLMSFPDFPERTDRTHGVSLFQRLDTMRTCADAGIPEQYCPCLTWKAVKSSHAHARKSAEAAVAHINTLLRNSALSAAHCVIPLTLTNVTGAVQKLPKIRKTLEMFHETECLYQVQFQTSPANAVFEALVRVTYVGEFEVSGSVDRVNAYGSQPDCVAQQLPALAPYCYCA